MTLYYLIFAFLVPVAFILLPVRHAILLSFLGGWLLLPVGQYVDIDVEVAFPWWISGLALPSDIWWNKAWIVPTLTLIFAVIADRKALKSVKFSYLDVVVLAWCLWPLSGLVFSNASSPSAVISSLYLFAVWGSSWCLARIWFSEHQDHILLLKAITLSGLLCLPFAIIEGVFGLQLYSVMFHHHPFATDGFDRYIGYRPIGLFEHGNQYGIWVSVAAFSACCLAVLQHNRPPIYLPIAIVTCVIAFASQSLGAIALIFLGGLLLLIVRSKMVWYLFIAGLGLIVVALLLHVSGIVPVEAVARRTDLGQSIISFFRGIGRGSFTWRISQEIKTMALLDGHWIFGTHIWDWWRSAGIRPWGLWLLVIGQYGLIGFALLYGLLMTMVLSVFSQMRGVAKLEPRLILAVIILIALADSMLNAFFYFPAIIAAGALVRNGGRSNVSTSRRNG